MPGVGIAGHQPFFERIGGPVSLGSKMVAALNEVIAATFRLGTSFENSFECPLWAGRVDTVSIRVMGGTPRALIAAR